MTLSQVSISLNYFEWKLNGQRKHLKAWKTDSKMLKQNHSMKRCSFSHDLKPDHSIDLIQKAIVMSAAVHPNESGESAGG